MTNIQRENMNRLLLFPVLVMLIGSGCAAFEGHPKNVVLKHPQTHEFVNCTVDKVQSKKSYEANQKCVDDYKAQGYVVWGQR